MAVTIGELIERNASCFADAEAFVFGERRLTYGQFADRVRGLAGGLYDLGLRRQDRVAILATNCVEYYETQGAAEWAGYIAAMVNFRLAAPEIRDVLEDAAPRILVFEAQYAPVVEQLRPDLPGIEHFISIGEAPAWAIDYESIIDQGLADGAPFRSRPEDFCHLYYTSGTTGRPKGVPQDHFAAMNAARSTSMSLAVQGNSRLLQITPAFHVGGKGFPLAALFNGATLILQRAFDPVHMLDGMRDEQVTHAFMVAAMLQEILDVPNLGDYEFPALSWIMTGAAPIPVPVLKRGIEVFGRVFTIQYGMTEVFGAVATFPPHEIDPDGKPEQVHRLASVGRVLAETESLILDQGDKVCPVGVTGEVCVKVPYFRGYWNNSVATIDALHDGWYRTGDMGYLDDAGYLFLVDRAKDMIISGGENVYSREVENAIFQHPDVVDVAVVGVPDSKWGEAVKAVVVLKPNAPVKAAQLRAHCKELIAGYKCPKEVEFVMELPRLPTGKVDKTVLREQCRGD